MVCGFLGATFAETGLSREDWGGKGKSNVGNPTDIHVTKMVSENIQLPETLTLEQDRSKKEQQQQKRLPECPPTGRKGARETHLQTHAVLLKKQDPEDCSRG